MEKTTYDLDSNFAFGTLDLGFATTVLVAVWVRAASHLGCVESCNQVLVGVAYTAGTETDCVESTITAKKLQMDGKSQGNVRKHKPCKNAKFDYGCHLGNGKCFFERYACKREEEREGERELCKERTGDTWTRG